MLNYLSDILGRQPMDYAGQRAMLASASSRARMNLAKNAGTHREILYHLAKKDPDPDVRAAVISNKSLSPHMSAVLTVDTSSDARLALAARLVDLVPDLPQERYAQLYAFAVQALGNLALDEVLKIPAAELAREVERMVSEPILRFCGDLSDRDLTNLLKLHPASWVVEAVSGRPFVRDDPFFPVIEADPVDDGADYGRRLLEKIVEQAREFPEWRKPLGVEKALPASVANKMADFVDDAIRDVLMMYEDFDGRVCADIVRVFRRRMDFVSDHTEDDLSIETRLETLIQQDALSEDVISDAAAMHDYDFVYGAIAHKAKTVFEEVQQVFELKAARSIVALCWRAGLSMRTAFALQRLVARVPPKQLIYPRGGTDYPLSEGDLTWQLEFLGLRSAAA